MTRSRSSIAVRLASACAAAALVLSAITASSIALRALDSGTSLAAERTAADRVIEAGRTDNQVVATLDHLVNTIGPRLTASANDHTACEWARELLESYGLDNARLEEAGEMAVQFNRGPWSGKMLAPEEMVLEFGTPAWSAGTRGVVRGHAVRPPEKLEGADASHFEGAWVLMERRRSRRDADARRADREVRRFLEDAGIAGYVYTTGSKYIRTGGNSRISWDELPETPRINLRGDQWDAIAEHVSAGEEVELQFDIRNHFKRGPVKFYNVIAEIPGSEFPDECVIVGGHIDSWDGATGTTDNGCGSAVALEAARILSTAGVRPRRTIRFMLWSGEEQGLLGSRAWVESHPDEIEKISAVLVFDGGPNAVAGIDCTPAMKEDFERVFAPVMSLDPEIPFQIDLREQGLTSGLGSDHISFLRENVPAFFWTQKGDRDWRHGIHTQFDTFDLAVPRYLEHSSIAVALAALGIADLDHLLSREKLRAPRRGGGFARPAGRMMGVYLDGTAVLGVIPETAAARAGVREGDVIARVDGTAVADRDALVKAIRGGAPDKKVVVKRAGEEVELHFTWPEEQKEKKADKPKKKIIL